MTERIFKSIVSVTTVALVLGFAFIVGILHQHLEDELYARLKTEAEYIGVAVEANGENYLEQLTNQQRITLISPEGNVLFDNQVDGSQLENHLLREEVQEALKSGVGQSERNSETLNSKIIYYAIKLSNGNILRVADYHSTITSLVFQLIQPMLIIIVGALCLSWFIAKRISKQITQPINELDLDHPENNEAYVELDPLLTRIYALKLRIKEQINEAIQKQEEFKMITDHMAEGFAVIGKDLSILSYNESIRQHLGLNQDITNETVYVLTHENRFIRFIEHTMKGEHSEWIQELDGRYFQWLSNPVVMNEEVRGAVIVMIDVTSKTKRDNYRREFTANISHELKTPLTSISGFAEIIQNGIVRQEDVQMFAGDIYKESQRLIQLVNDIIRISQLDDSTLVYQKEKVIVKDEINSLIDIVAHSAKKRNISIFVRGEAVEIDTVPSIFHEVVYNLLDNAVKYNKENGEINIVYGIEENHFVLSVNDTGIGIPIQDQQRIFERFYRVDKSRSSQNGGTGLGLSIVKHGVTTLGGTVELKSVLHEGTEITIILPLN